jgi:hypothetical protein
MSEMKYKLPLVFDENTNTIRTTEDERVASVPYAADGEEIVRACNSHYELVEALKALLGAGAEPSLYKPQPKKAKELKAFAAAVKRYMDACALAQTALAKAGETK